MNRLLLALFLALAAAPALAQSSATPVVPGYLSSNGCPPAVTTCFAPSLAPIAGTQTNVAMTTATALTVPAKATFAIITVSGTNNTAGVCAYWEDDGTAPTGTTGQPLAALAGFTYFVKSLAGLKLIQATGASCTFTASYYG